MNSKEMRVLRDLMEQVQSHTEWDESLRELICARLSHCEFTKVNEVKLFDVNLPLPERVEALLTNQHDWLFGSNVAHRFGLLVGAGIKNYDPRLYHRNIGWPQKQEIFFRYLRGLGCRPDPTVSGSGCDGISHYNIYSKSRTQIGRMASNFESAPNDGFDTPHGKFRTLEGYYHVLRLIDYFASCEDVADGLKGKERIAYDLGLLTVYSKQYPAIDDLYRLDGAECIQVGRSVKRDVYGGTHYRPGAFSAHAEHCFMTAMVQKLHLLQYENRCLGNVLAEIVQQGVKLDHYYVMQGKIIRPKFSEWLPDLITRIVEQIDPYANTFDPNQVIHQLE